MIAYTAGKAASVTAPAATAGATRQVTSFNYVSQPIGVALGETRVNVTGLSEPLGFTRKSRWDLSWRERESTDAAGRVATVTYDGSTDRVSYADTDSAPDRDALVDGV